VWFRRARADRAAPRRGAALRYEDVDLSEGYLVVRRSYG
jgi:hypothetical protein